jgi:signal transduction histidine kinase
LLVVDDDVELRTSLADVLRDAGFGVLEAANGQDALTLLRSEPPPDAILLDLMMPVMDGWEFRAAQKREPSLARTPVVVMTADGSPHAEAVDAALFVRKPFDLRTLLDGVDRVLVSAERRKFGEQLAHADRLASLGTLAAGIAHEINNPLAILMGNLSYAETLVDSSPAAPRIREHLRASLEAAHRIRRIVRDVGSFARQNALLRIVDPRAVLEGALAMVESQLRQRARVECKHDAVPPVMADEGRLAQVFVNLLLNALQAFPDSDEPGEIRTRTGESESGDVFIEVSDTGCGIPAELLDAIFDPFFTTKPPGEGTGLGLSITASILKSLGGSIRVESKVGVGTTFRVTLPRAETCAAEVGQASKPRHKKPAPARSRILVIDDEERVADVLVMLLGDDHDVDVETSGRAALDRLLEGRPYDAVLCDLNLKDFPSWTLYDELSARKPEVARRMIFMTGGAYTARSRELLQRAPNGCVEKPFVPSEVQQQLERVLSTRSQNGA